MTQGLPGVVVLIHGAGLDPRLYDPLMTMLSVPSVAPLRPAYRAATDELPTVEVQATEMLGHLDEWASSAGNTTDDVTLVGVSGGATLALAAAVALASGAEPSRPVAAVVSHEPLLGPLAPALNARVTEAAAALRATDDVETFLSGLVGEATWTSVPEALRRFARRHLRTVVADVDRFIAYAPTATDLARLEPRFTATVGELSDHARLEAAGLLGDLGNAETATVPEAGHLAHWQVPAAFAEVIMRSVGGRRETAR